MFRFFFFLTIVDLIALTSYYGLGLFIIISLFLVLASLGLLYTKGKYRQKNPAFAIKSIRRQINEFKFIERLSFLSPSMKKRCKEFSILTDTIHLKKTNSYSEVDYFGDSTYSISVTIMYHDNSKF